MLEIQIAALRDRVWKALTHETNAWWLPSFHMVAKGSVVSFRAEAGGQLLEKREGGGSLLWCTVHVVDPGVSIHMVGHNFPEWGGPCTGTLKFSLEDRDGGCTPRRSAFTTSSTRNWVRQCPTASTM